MTKSLNITEKMVLGTAQFGMDYGIANVSGKPSKKEVFFDMDSESWEYLNKVKDEYSCSIFGLMKIYRLLDSRHYNRSSYICDKEAAYT